MFRVGGSCKLRISYEILHFFIVVSTLKNPLTFNIEYKQILTAREDNMGYCHPEKTNVDRGGHWFSRGANFPCYPLVQSIFIILY